MDISCSDTAALLTLAGFCQKQASDIADASTNASGMTDPQEICDIHFTSFYFVV